MYKLPTIVIQYDKEIDPKALPFFRGAIIASLKSNDILFHNHDEDKLRYSYPLIQYKRINKKAVVMGIGKGIEVICQLLTARDFNYKIGNEKVELRIHSVNAYDNEIVLTEETNNRYSLHNWLPLNSENYKQYQEAETMIERIQILERILVGNTLSFLKGVGIYLDEQLKISITHIKGQRAVTYKNVKLMGFDIEFKANITIPQYIGIGKNASIGFGVVTVIEE